jgi:hypothetical protein
MYERIGNGGRDLTCGTFTYYSPRNRIVNFVKKYIKSVLVILGNSIIHSKSHLSIKII